LLSAIPLIDKVGHESLLRPEAYLAVNADVREAKMDPREHYLRYGQFEGRKQLVDSSIVGTLRDQKLSRVQFRDDPKSPRSAGQAFDYLPAEIRESFHIPEVVPIANNDYNAEIIKIIEENPGALMLDVGAGFRHTYYSNVVNAEIWAATSTDVVCVGEDLPFASEQFDYIFCLAVLEHTKRPWIACQEILRVLKPGGSVRIDWPFLQPFHGYPHHFFNATSVGTISMFEETCDIVEAEVKPWQHPIFALEWLLKEWSLGLADDVREKFSEMTVRDFLASSNEEMLQEAFCSKLSAETQGIISAGTTITARKR